MPKTITAKEAARRLDVHPATVIRAVRAGKIRARFGGIMKNRVVGIYEEDVENILKTTASN